MKQKGFAPIIIIVLITLGIAGYFGYRQFKPTINKFFSSPTPTSDPTADWKTYSDRQGRFSFKYPSAWWIEEFDAGAETISYIDDNDQVSLGITDIISPLSIGKECKSLDDISENINFSYKVNIAVYDCGSLNQHSVYMDFEYNDTPYRLGYNYNKNLESKYIGILNQILSTFKFLEEGDKSNNSKYACPANGWVNCMPGPDMPREECSQDAMDWYEENCPNFQGSAI